MLLLLRRVHLPALLFLWAPAQGVLIAVILWLSGVYGSRPVCTSIYQEGCHPPGALPALADVDCRDWGW